MAETAPALDNGHEQYIRMLEMSMPVLPDLRTGESVPRALNEISIFVDIPEDASVLYPESSTHVDVANFFGKDKVVHVDPNSLVCSALINYDYIAVQTRVEEYEPEELFDVLVAINTSSKLSPDKLDNLVKPGGIVIANNTTKRATDLLDGGNQLVGAVKPDFRVNDTEYVRQKVAPKTPLELVGELRDTLLLGPGEDHRGALQAGDSSNGLYVFKKTGPTSTG